jgi:hypothetical protein
MSSVEPVDLQRRRDLPELLRTSLRLYRENARTLLAVTATIVLTVDLIMGIGLGQLSAAYQSTVPKRVSYVELLVQLFVLAPLVNATVALLVLDRSAGRQPRLREVLQRGLDVFAPALLVVVLWALAVLAGSLLIVLGVYFLVIWYFGVQCVAVEGRRGLAALQRSAELVSGNWFRVAGLLLTISLLGNLVPGLVVALAADALAQAANAQVIVLLGTMIVQTFSLSLIGVATTLLFFDLRVRRAAVDAGQPPLSV